MKHGKKPTVAQRKLMTKWKLDWRDWFVERETLTKLVLIHRHFDKTKRIIPKGVREDEL
jgi:hypothetical protein